MNFKSTKDLTNGKCLVQVLIINSKKPFYFKFRDFTIENNSLVFSWRIQIAFCSLWYRYQCGRCPGGQHELHSRLSQNSSQNLKAALLCTLIYHG